MARLKRKNCTLHVSRWGSGYAVPYCLAVSWFAGRCRLDVFRSTLETLRQENSLGNLYYTSFLKAAMDHRALHANGIPIILFLSHLYQRRGYRQHLVQALAEAASGPVPPCVLLPILRAKETGPSATDLAMEVLETVAGNEQLDGSGSAGAKSKRAVLGNRADGYSGRHGPGEGAGVGCRWPLVRSREPIRLWRTILRAIRRCKQRGTLTVCSCQASKLNVYDL